jgi:hypothetical protein
LVRGSLAPYRVGELMRKTLTVAAIAIAIAGCSRTPEQQPVSSSQPAPEAAPPLPAKPASVTIGQGTRIQIRTETELSTKDVKTGDSFTATLAEPISVDGQVIAPRGARVDGRVVDSDPGGRVKGVATISVRLTQLHVGGHPVAIRTGAIVREAHATKRKDAVKVGIGAGIGAAIGAIAGGGQGAAIGAASGGAAGTGVGPGDARGSGCNRCRERTYIQADGCRYDRAELGLATVSWRIISRNS